MIKLTDLAFKWGQTFQEINVLTEFPFDPFCFGFKRFGSFDFNYSEFKYYIQLDNRDFKLSKNSVTQITDSKGRCLYRTNSLTGILESVIFFKEPLSYKHPSSRPLKFEVLKSPQRVFLFFKENKQLIEIEGSIDQEVSDEGMTFKQLFELLSKLSSKLNKDNLKYVNSILNDW